MNFKVTGNIVDIINKKIFKGEIEVEKGKIRGVREASEAGDNFILPGFIDAHVHVESSMLIPSEFARLAVTHGTVATVSDPHEIGNVLGLSGVKFMIENGKTVPFKFNFGAPSCVPATVFETAGADITAAEIEELFKSSEIKYLAEMMNWPGVLYKDKDVYEKIDLAKKYGKLIDGHAPGLKGELAKQYAEVGITTDHECFTEEEARDKLACGMKILIREGSAAKNFDALINLLNDHEDEIMFCSDDKHPDNLLEGHINELVKRALSKKIDLFKVLKAASLNPVKHYGLEVGLLQNGDSADFIVVNNLEEFKILQTYIDGKLVSENGQTLIQSVKAEEPNQFNTDLKISKDFIVKATSGKVKAIKALDGQLITLALDVELPLKSGEILSSEEKDILKIAVVNRYKNSKPAVAFINGFNLKKGALASSIAHDSHNIVAVGTSDELLCKAINEVIKNKGGISAVSESEVHSLPLPVAGLMSAEDGYMVAQKYTEIDKISKTLGSNLKSPFMTLSFMALLVIPSLKLSDMGLFDGDQFRFLRYQ